MAQADHVGEADFGTFHLTLARLTAEMRKHGLIIRNDSRNDPTSQLCPPLVITREECDRTVAVMEETITDLGRQLGTVGTVHPAS